MGHKFNADSRAKTRAYIVRCDDNARLTFQFNPTQIPYSRSAKYSNIESPGMSYPLTQYAGGNVRQFSFEVFMYDRPYTGKIKTARDFLETLLPPETNVDGFTRPSAFMLAYGYFVKKLVLEQLEVGDEVLDENGNPVQVKFTLNVRQI